VVTAVLALPLLLVVSGVVGLLEDINPLVEVVLHLRAEKSEDDEARLLAPLPLLLAVVMVFVARTVKAMFALRFVCAGKFTFVWQLKWIKEDMCTRDFENKKSR
jgi:hypothetical protein